MMELAVGFSSLNVVVLVGLAYLYARIAWHARALQPIGLLVFASFLLLQNMVTVVSYISMAPFIGGPVLPYLLVISMSEFAGLVALIKVTL